MATQNSRTHKRTCHCEETSKARRRGNLLLDFPNKLQEIATSGRCAPLLAMTSIFSDRNQQSKNRTLPGAVSLSDGLGPMGHQQAGDHPDELVQQHIDRGQQLHAAEDRQHGHNDHAQQAADKMDGQP